MRQLQSRTARWYALLYGLLVLLMLFSLVVFSIATWSNVKAQLHETLLPENNSLASNVNRFFSHQETLLEELAVSILKQGSSDSLIKTRLNDVLMATPQMRVLAIIDVKGNILTSTGDIKTLEWADLFTGDAVIGRPFRPTFVGESVLPFRKPFKNAQGQTIGYVVAAYRMLGNDSILPLQTTSKEFHRSMLIGLDGRVYLSFPETDVFWQSFVSATVDNTLLTTLAEITANQSEMQVREVQYEEVPTIIMAQKLENYPIYAVSGISHSELFPEWFERMKYVALAVLIFLAMGLFVFRTIVKRASRFESARNIAENNVHKLSQAIEQSPNSVIVTDNHWVVEYANNRLSVEGETPLRMKVGDQLLDLFPHTLLQSDVRVIQDNLRNGSNWYGERRAKDQKKWFSFSVSSLNDDDGEIINYVIITQDISERKRAEVRLYKQANFDALTGLPNRRRTNDLLTEAIKNAWKENQKIAVLYMDVDNFKQINDTFGHMLGDQMLQLVAVRLQQSVSNRATACHMSGDEFLVYMQFNDENDIVALAENIMEVMKQPVLLEGKKLFISVSLGISRFPEDSDDVSGMLKHADIALYESKNRGRRCYSFFSRELDAKNKRKVELETEVRHALAQNELFMVYQTKNRIDTGEVYGFEALMRWQSGRLGFVSPDEFINAAEEIGVIDSMGEFALIQACKDLQKYQKLCKQPLSMAVNVSMRQLTNSDIVGTVKNVLTQTGLNPNRLELEITESMLAQNIEEVQPVLNGLLELGVSLSIDDFGTGYSSLSYLTRFPVSTLKIDRCFIKDMVENRSDATLTHTVVTMAHKLGLKVVAEGIEEADQLALLRVYGCDIGQGYYFTKPLNFEQMSSHLIGLQEKPDWAI